MIKVLHVTGKLDPGGVENLLQSISLNWKENSIDFSFVQHTNDGDGSYTQGFKDRGIKVWTAPKYSLINHQLYVKWWEAFFSDHKDIDIVHSHIRSTASIITKIARKHNLKTIVHAHGLTTGAGIKSIIKKILQKNITSYADKLISCSMSAAKSVFGKNIDKDKRLNIVVNPVQLDRFCYSSENRTIIKNKLNITNNEIVIGHVGNFRPEKNHRFIVEIFIKLNKEKPDKKFVLLLIGKGDTKEQITDMLKKARLFSNSRILYITENIEAYYSAMDVFLFPSKSEGFGLAALEAQASGVPCLLSADVPKEAVVTSSSKIISSYSVNLWVSEILRSIQLGNNEKAHMEILSKEYDIESIIEEYERIYFELDTNS